MKVKIVKRKLKEWEIKTLSEETKKTMHIGLIKPYVWIHFPITYIAETNNKLIGVCAVYPLKNWAKLGPILVLEKHLRKGIGTMLINKIVKDFQKTNLYVGSSNLAIHKIASKTGFEETSYFKLPWIIKKHLLSYFFQRFGLEYVFNSMLKKIKRGAKKYNFYVLLRRI